MPSFLCRQYSRPAILYTILSLLQQEDDDVFLEEEAAGDLGPV